MRRYGALSQHFYLTLFFEILSISVCVGIANSNVSPTSKPVLGWNSFRVFACGPIAKESNYKNQADAMAEKGLAKAGYKTVIVECGWEESSAQDGTPTVKHRSFNDGLQPFSDYLKSKGLQLGLGTWGGDSLCPPRPYWRKKRSLNHLSRRGPMVGDADPDKNGLEKRQAMSFHAKYISTLAQWGLTYLSHRPCGWTSPQRVQDLHMAQEMNDRYVQMADGIRDAGAHVFYATGEWGVSPAAHNKRANSWRISDEPQDKWNSFIRILNALVPFASKAGPGAYNDLGFLRVEENRLSTAEKTTQIAFWAAAKSPLIFSADVWTLDDYLIEMLKNPGMLGINQDDLGTSITFKRRYSGDMDIWSGPLSDGSTVAVIVNWVWSATSKSIDLADLGFTSAQIYDVWTGKDLGIANNWFTANVEMRGSLFLKLTDTKPFPKRNFKQYPAEKADAIGSAKLKQVTPNVQAVSLIGPNGKGGVRWKDVDGGPNGGNVLVSIDFINADLSAGNTYTGKLNYKPTVITVNDKDKVYVDFPLSGQTWEDIFQGFLVTLPLLPGESNKILIEGIDDWAPDFVSIGVEVPASS